MRSSTSLLALAFAPLLAACADGTSTDDSLAFIGDNVFGEEGGGGSGGSLAIGTVEGDATLTATSRQPPSAQAIESGAGGAGSTTTSGAGGDGSTTTSGAGGDGSTTTSGAGGDGSTTTSGAGGDDTSTTSTGGDPNASDTCPGELHAITLGAAPYVVDGDTTGATDAIETCWSVDVADDGADRIYAFDLPSAGIFRVELESLTEGYQPVLVVRDTCEERLDEYCHDGGTTTQVHRAAHGAGRVYVGVDSPGLTAGAFRLTATLVEEGCGDGLVGPTEECDVGAGVDADGCGNPGSIDECLLTGPNVPIADDCTDGGQALNVPGGTSVVSGFALTTNGFGDDAKGTCMPETGGADRVFRLMPQATGMLEVRAGFDDAGTNAMCSADYTAPGCFDVELYVRSTCDSADPADEIACKSDCCDGETMQFPVTSGEAVFLFVDGYDSEWYSRGPFNLHFQLNPG